MKFVHYVCKCGFKTGSREAIRKHVRDVHGIKGHKEHPYHSNIGLNESAITGAYRTLRD